MSFDPQAFQEQEEQRTQKLEEITGSDIAFRTLKDICAEIDGSDTRLENDVIRLYETAEAIELEALGTSRGLEGRKAMNQLMTTRGKSLFASLMAEDADNEPTSEDT
ncbi:MAG: hypothetical protein L0I84_01930 [Halomonas subglaciescola]|nr:hypothetical protein [Halomonas subglaciescola]